MVRTCKEEMHNVVWEVDYGGSEEGQRWAEKELGRGDLTGNGSYAAYRGHDPRQEDMRVEDQDRRLIGSRAFSRFPYQYFYYQSPISLFFDFISTCCYLYFSYGSMCGGRG